MTPSLFDTYRATHQQGFIPIFVRDDFDTRTLLEACLAAGLRVIEYTLRRGDCRQAIAAIRRDHPELIVLAGSTIDHAGFVAQLRPRHPQLMSVDELAAAGVHGFVSQLPWTAASLARWSATHLVCPYADSLVAGFHQLVAGAHFIKMTGPSLDAIRQAHSPPTFGLMPLFVTGGQTPATIGATVDAGAHLIASGFDLMLRDVPPASLTASKVADVLRTHVAAVHEARARAYPDLRQDPDAPRGQWLASLPHVHPFG